MAELPPSIRNRNTLVLDTTNAPSIRVRTRAGVPKLDFTGDEHSHFNAAHVLHDRLGYHLELPIRFSSGEVLDSYLEYIADPAMLDPALLSGVPGQRGGNRTRMKFQIARGWHLTGTVTLRLNANLQGNFDINLSLNPTRWSCYQDERALPELADRDPVDVLRLAERTRTRGSLDGNDNLLPNRSRVGSPLADNRVAQSIEFAGVYLQKVQDLLRLYLSAAPDQFAPGQVVMSDIQLRGASAAESYLEFYSEDAIASLEQMRDVAISGLVDPQWRTFVGKHIDGGMERNSPSLTFKLTKDVSAAFYAKTTRTIRAEIRYSSDIREKAFPRRERGTQQSPIRELAALRHDAVRRLRTIARAFSRLMALVVPGGTRMHLLDLVDAIYRATDCDPVRARDLLSLLGNVSGITETDEEGIAVAIRLAAIATSCTGEPHVSLQETSWSSGMSPGHYAAIAVRLLPWLSRR